MRDFSSAAAMVSCALAQWREEGANLESYSKRIAIGEQKTARN